jgi:hypothetical protein
MIDPIASEAAKVLYPILGAQPRARASFESRHILLLCIDQMVSHHVRILGDPWCSPVSFDIKVIAADSSRAVMLKSTVFV